MMLLNYFKSFLCLKSKKFSTWDMTALFNAVNSKTINKQKDGVKNYFDLQNSGDKCSISRKKRKGKPTKTKPVKLKKPANTPTLVFSKIFILILIFFL